MSDERFPNWRMVTTNRYGQEVRRLQFAAHSRDGLEDKVWTLLCQTRADEYCAFFQSMYAYTRTPPVSFDNSGTYSGPDIRGLCNRRSVQAIEVALPPDAIWVDADHLTFDAPSASMDTQVRCGSVRSGYLRRDVRDAENAAFEMKEMAAMAFGP